MADWFPLEIEGDCGLGAIQPQTNVRMHTPVLDNILHNKQRLWRWKEEFSVADRFWQQQ